MNKPISSKNRKNYPSSLQKNKKVRKTAAISKKNKDNVNSKTSEQPFISPDSSSNFSEDELTPKPFNKSPEHPTSSNTDEAVGKSPISDAQRAKIELNRQKALLIRQDKKNKRKPYEKVETKKETTNKVIRINDLKLIDTGGGFFIEEKKDVTEEDLEAAMHIITDPAPLMKCDQHFCVECSQPFDNSFLHHNFGEQICDNCRNEEDIHSLITKTDAKNNYLLKDVDFDKRVPPLKYIVRKNPHNSSWGDMKLYLKLQVERRALEIWETEEAIEEALQKREDQREVAKQKNYKKKMKELRMNVRSSLYTRATKNHEHEYGEEVYHSDDDEYSKTCSTCGHSYKYDKM